MKKFLAAVLAAVCALSVTAFAACSIINSANSTSGSNSSNAENSSGTGGTSDSGSTGGETTLSEWETAFAETNFYNVTAKLSGTGTSGDTQSYIIKYDVAVQSDGYITGVMYLAEYAENGGYDKIYYYIVEYNAENGDYYYYRATDYEDGSFGYSQAEVSTGYYLYDLEQMVYLPSLIDYSGSFTCSDGTYTGAVSWMGNSKITIVISDGKLVKADGMVVDSFTLSYELYDYGTTSVEIPAGISFTYEQAAVADDISVLKSLNTALSVYEVIGDAPETLEEVVSMLEQDGFVFEEMKISEGYTVYWDSAANRMILWSVSGSYVVYPYSGYDGVTSVQSTWYDVSSSN